MNTRQHLLHQPHARLGIEVRHGRIPAKSIVGRCQPRYCVSLLVLEGRQRDLVDVHKPPQPVRFGAAQLPIASAALQRTLRDAQYAKKYILRQGERARYLVERTVG